MRDAKRKLLYMCVVPEGAQHNHYRGVWGVWGAWGGGGNLDNKSMTNRKALLRNFLTWNKGAMRGRPPYSSRGGGCRQSAPTEAGRLRQIPAVRICKPFKEPRNRFPAWRNRFLDSTNVYKYELCSPQIQYNIFLKTF